MIVIPAIDLRDGRCVRLAQGRKSDVTVYNEHPLAVAKEFSRFVPATWTSIGAGRPRFSTASTMPPEEK